MTGKVPCNNCGAGSQISKRPWHMTGDCPDICTLCNARAGHAHGAGCPRSVPELNGKGASRGAPTRWDRHPKRVMMAEAKQAATKSMAEINGKLQLANLAAEDREHLDSAYRTLEIEYVQLEAGEAAFIAAAARGELDRPDRDRSEARYIVGCL